MTIESTFIKRKETHFVLSCTHVHYQNICPIRAANFYTSFKRTISNDTLDEIRNKVIAISGGTIFKFVTKKYVYANVQCLIASLRSQTNNYMNTCVL